MTSRIEHNDPKGHGAFSLTYHYEMLADAKRVTPFARAIEQQCEGKVVFESGTGTGVMSLLAARAGATHVFCTELDPTVAEFAKLNFGNSGFGSKITLLQKSTLDVTLADLGGVRPDVIIAENLATWQVTEPQNQVMNHLRRTVGKDSTIAIPAIAHNYVQLAESSYTFFDAVELKAHYFEFAGIRGATVRSAPTLFSTFDYSHEVPTTIEKEIEVRAWTRGVVNSLRMTSPLVVSEGNTFDSSDSLMPPVVVPLPTPVTVEVGEVVTVFVRYDTHTSWPDVVCAVTKR